MHYAQLETRLPDWQGCGYLILINNHTASQAGD
jgi:hypothetical protein